MSVSEAKNEYASMAISSHFLNTAVKSYTFSSRYIVTLMRATVLNILYHRLEVDEEEFLTKTFKKVTFKSFSNYGNGSQYLKAFHTYMTGFKDAFLARYLRHFYLIFLDASGEEIIERYKFSFKYCTEEEIQSQPKEILEELTINLLSALKSLEHFQKLKNVVRIRCELTYVDGTPLEYQPRGFMNLAEGGSLRKKLTSKSKKDGGPFTIPVVSTGFHVFKCSALGFLVNKRRGNLKKIKAIEATSMADERKKSKKRFRDNYDDKENDKSAKYLRVNV